MIVKNNKFIVETPDGWKPHGFIKDNKFCRRVEEKDRMRIFDAWSINPEVLEYLKTNNIPELHYKDEVKDYKISLENAILYGYEDTFAGGKTFYIPIKFWVSENKKQKKLI